MEEQPLERSKQGNSNVTRLLVFAFFIFLMWTIYTASQMQTVDTPTNPMNNAGSSTQITSTPMPDDMPGMDH